MKKIVILKHNDGELANQLWNYISIYAYGLHAGARVENPSFFEYHKHFNFLKNEGIVTTFFSYWFRGEPQRRATKRNQVWRKVYKVYVKCVSFFEKSRVISSESKDVKVTYIPPTSPLQTLGTLNTTYLTGWLFRNPVGLKKFRKELVRRFTPSREVEKRVTDISNSLRSRYGKIIGVHIRQADYKVFKGGTYFISQEKVRKIIEEYMEKNSINRNSTVFLITSDGHIDATVFNHLNIHISKENAVTDLFLLSSTDAIIGSDSSFGVFAAWYGNIPHIVMKNTLMDWDYYVGKAEFFESKYLTMVHF